MYALVDGNNFYVSCERVLRPSLQGRPVIVLSNNDGCAIARSNEAKVLGIAMGAPWFQIQRELPDAGVLALSANFTLYGDMSSRMMSIAAGLGPDQEIYSIDESFIGVAGIRDMTRRSQAMRERILQWTGIPCGIGIGMTKTLAKLANHVAKSAGRKPGSYPVEFARVANLATLPASDQDAVLQATALGDIWGIGRRIGEQLRADGLETALDVARQDPTTVRRRWSVVLERTVHELQGQPCVGFETVAAAKKEIACTRSFGRPIEQLKDLIEAVTDFCSRAAEKLRKQDGHAVQLLVFIHTAPFRPQDRQYSRSVTVPLRRPTAETALIAASAIRGLKAIFKPDYKYAKTGVMLLDLQDASVEQGELDFDDPGRDRGPLMSALDAINRQHGRGAIQPGSAGMTGAKRQWVMRQSLKTPNYTTSWADLPVART
ncbi:DNA polymerase V [Variovorax sp. GrIS 2.14]|uniref:Y-family DNA polymerase n=1 Tax=Variovorax sp. GrIS 2.14 TaxID=3071709 RepID=UPI0038F74F1B